jgi:hypothetical protein
MRLAKRAWRWKGKAIFLTLDAEYRESALWARTVSKMAH